MSPHYPLFAPIGQPFIVLPTVDSTNNYAMAQLKQGLAAHGSVYFALEQTAGRGQRGRQWITEPGQNIMISIVASPGTPFILSPFAFSASIALGCYDFYKKYGSADETRIKWPNDLYWQDRKAGGVLIESVVGNREPSDLSREAQDIKADQLQSDLNAGLSVNDSENQGPLTPYVSSLTPPHSPLTTPQSQRFVIVGIGVNVNQTVFDPALKNPVSLKQITGKNRDPIALAKELCEAIDLRYKQFLLLTPAEIIADYQSVLYKKDQKVRLKKENSVFETTIRGVTVDGRLKTVDMMDREWVWGEVEWVV